MNVISNKGQKKLVKNFHFIIMFVFCIPRRFSLTRLHAISTKVKPKEYFLGAVYYKK